MMKETYLSSVAWRKPSWGRRRRKPSTSEPPQTLEKLLVEVHQAFSKMTLWMDSAWPVQYLALSANLMCLEILAIVKVSDIITKRIAGMSIYQDDQQQPSTLQSWRCECSRPLNPSQVVQHRVGCKPWRRALRFAPISRKALTMG